MEVHDAEDGKTGDRTRSHVEVRRDTSTLLAGATRSGKSEAAKVLVHQMLDRWGTTEPLVAYDRKDDWQTFFRSEGADFEILSADPEEATVTWDLFAEVRDERDIDRIARGLFDADKRSGNRATDEFFETAGRQVFAGVCKYLYRSFGENDRTPTNADLLRYIQTTSREQAYEDLSRYDDLGMAAQSIDPEAEGQAAGVWANLTQDVADLFVGTFRDPPERLKTISLRDYFDEIDGQVRKRTPSRRAVAPAHFGDLHIDNGG